MRLKIVGETLAQISRQTIRDYSTYDFGRQKDNSAKSVVVEESIARSILFEIRQNLDRGMIAFIGTTCNLETNEFNKAEIVIALGKSQFDIIKIARCNDRNCGLSTENIIDKLKQYDRNFGINIFHAELNTIKFTFKSLPENITKFCQDLYSFCPDLLDSGIDSNQELKARIRIAQEVYPW